MNKHFFAIIYSEARDRWVVVRESASAKGAPRYCGAIAMLLGHLLALGAMQAVPAFAQVVADAAASPANRPVVNATANGRTLVQITSPTAAGVSKNFYAQFNVDPSGVILNNATATTLSQQGGYVAKNPNLSGSARIILNQVTGANPTSIRGYLEVAGQRADVVVANPNGIVCNGGGFINTSRAVLTTGIPVMGASGSLDAFRTTQGQIQIGSAGFDGTTTDQLDLIARSIQVNGQLWAGQRLDVVAGANQVDYANLGVQVIQGEGGQPTAAIDVGQLGGMYAGKIRLVGTESGVGVNSQGTLAAQAGDFELSSSGRITLLGQATASGSINLSAVGDLDNEGLLYAQQSAALSSQSTVRNPGRLAAGGDLSICADAIISPGFLGAGIDTGGAATRTGNLGLAATGDVILGGRTVAHDSLALAGGRLELAQAILAAGAHASLASAGDIDTHGTSLQTGGNLDLSARGTWNDQHGKVLAGGTARLTVASLDNGGGTLCVGGDAHLQASTLSNDQSGSIIAGGNLVLEAQALLDNHTGMLYAGTDLTVRATTGALVNAGGQLASARDLSLGAGSLDGAGSILGGRDVSLSLGGDFTNPQSASIAANRSLSLAVAGAITNAGDLEAGTLSLQAGSLDNQATGLIDGSRVTLRAVTQLVNTGRIFGDALGLQAGQSILNDAGGAIASRGALDLGAPAITNRAASWLYASADLAVGGTLDASGRAAGSADSLSNGSALIQSETGNITLAAQSVRNTNDALQTEQRVTSRTPFTQIQPKLSSAVYDISALIPTTGIDGIGGCYLLPDGSVAADYTLMSGTRTVTNSFVTQSAPARILAGGGIKVDARDFLNADSQIIAGGALDIRATGSLENRGTEGHRVTTDSGTANYTWTEWHGNKDGRSREWSGPTAYNPAPQDTPQPLGLAVLLDHTASAGSNPAAGRGPTDVVPPAVGPVQVSPISGLGLPGSRMYQVLTIPGHTYLVETDPRFTNYQTFLSSDYMLTQMALDPSSTLKRLGDGFYETQLVNRQIQALTGRLYLQGQVNAFDEYRALMDSGVAYAKAFHLEPGMALTDAQMAALTSDMVWLVKQGVTLPDGHVEQVLVPVVYLARAHAQDIQPTGALLSGENLSLYSQGTLENSGTLLAANHLIVSARDLANQGHILAGGEVDLVATHDVLNQGSITASRVAIVAGNDLTLQTALHQMVGLTGSATELGQVSGIQADQLSLQAGWDLSLQGAQLNVKNDATLAAGRDLNLQAVTTTVESHLVWDAQNHLVQSQDTVNGSSLHTGGNLTLGAGRNVAAQAASITSDQAIQIQAAGNVTLGTAQENSSLDEAHHYVSHGVLSSSTVDSKLVQSAEVQVGTTVSGNTISIQSGKDLAITGSSVAGTGDVALAAGNDVSIQAATNLQTQKRYEHERDSGLMSGGSFGITIGAREQTDQYDQQATTQSRSRSLVGSTDGSLSIVAGNQAHISGSDLVAGQDVSLAAKTVTIDPGQDQSHANESHDFSQSGLTLAVSSPVLSAAQTVQTMKEAAIESRDPRVRALAAATAGLAAKNAYDAVSADPKAAGGATISLTYGESRSHSESETDARSTAGSLVKAGRNVSIAATGGDLNVVGSTVQGGNDVTLKAAGNLNLVSSQDTDTTRSRSNGSSWGVGVAVTYGSSGWAFGVTANASKNHGNSNGSDVTQANTHIVAGSKTSLTSGQDTNLKGAVVSGSQVSADVGGNLNIESMQDTSTYHSQDSSTGGSVTVGAGVAASVNLGRQRMNSDYASATEQSGLQAGDGGFRVNVKGNTDLKGGVIASTDKAVTDGKNTLTTGSLTVSDIQNHADYDAKGSSVTFGGQTATNPAKAPNGDAKGPLSVTPLTGGASALLQGDASGITRSGISGIAGNISIRTGDASGGIGRNFNAGDVQKQLNAQVTVTQAFNQLAPVAAREYATKRLKELKKEYEETTDPAKREELANDIKNWQPHGAYSMVMDVIIGAAGGNLKSTLTKETLVLAAQKMRETMIENSMRFKGIKDQYGNIISNDSGASEGVDGDGKKVGGGRMDLTEWKKRGAITPSSIGEKSISGYKENSDGYVIFTAVDNQNNPISIYDFINDSNNNSMISPLGGHQGGEGKIQGVDYQPGSLMDRLVESYSGTHDFLNSPWFYDRLGNNKDISGTIVGKLGTAINGGDVIIATPLGMSMFLPPEVWNAINSIMR